MMKKTDGRNSNRFSLRFLVLYFIFIVSFICFFASGVIDSEDGWLYFSVAKNIYYHHQATAAPYEYPIGNVNMNSLKDKNGVWRAPYSLGFSLAMVPAVALSDMVHRYYGSSPPNHFPLEHDWSLHFFASMTNSFFAGMIAVTILLYAVELGLTKRQAIVLSLLTIFTTNLFPLAKFSFAHEMFAAFTLVSFYMVKRFSITKQWKYLLGCALSYGVVLIAYNVSYYIPLIPLVLYLLLLFSKKDRIRMILALSLIAIPIFIIKRATFIPLMTIPFITSYKVLFEGVWGYVFSPGKSMFLYSPLLLLLPAFWHKLQKKHIPEIMSFTLMLMLFIYFLGSAWVPKLEGQKLPIWHGGMSWGPRYISATIPFLMLLVGTIIFHLKRIQKLFFVLPLLLWGVWMQILGVSLPYLTQYADLPLTIIVRDLRYDNYDYASFIPTLSPIISQTHNFFSRLKTFPRSVDRGIYTVRLFDGFDFPLTFGDGTSIRGFRQEGHIAFTNLKENNISKITMTLLNAPDSRASSESATVAIMLNKQLIRTVKLPPQEDLVLEEDISALIPSEGQSYLSLIATYDTKTVVPHVIYIKKLVLNTSVTNLASLDYPDVSTMGTKTTPIPYLYYGNQMQDRWTLWHMRSRIMMSTFDFWWIKNLYYWDRPRALFNILLAINMACICCSSALILLLLKKRQE